LDMGTGAVTINGPTTTITVSANTLSIGGVIANGTGSGFTKAGAGTLSLSGTSTYTGTTTLSNGTLIATSDTALGTSGLTIAPTGSSATVDFTSANPAIGSLSNSGAGASSVVLGNAAASTATTLTVGGNN